MRWDTHCPIKRHIGPNIAGTVELVKRFVVGRPDAFRRGLNCIDGRSNGMVRH